MDLSWVHKISKKKLNRRSYEFSREKTMSLEVWQESHASTEEACFALIFKITNNLTANNKSTGKYYIQSIEQICHVILCFEIFFFEIFLWIRRESRQCWKIKIIRARKVANWWQYIFKTPNGVVLCFTQQFQANRNLLTFQIPIETQNWENLLFFLLTIESKKFNLFVFWRDFMTGRSKHDESISTVNLLWHTFKVF